MDPSHEMDPSGVRTPTRPLDPDPTLRGTPTRPFGRGTPTRPFGRSVTRAFGYPHGRSVTPKLRLQRDINTARIDTLERTDLYFRPRSHG